MTCRKCNSQNEEQANFCSSCGADLKKAKMPIWMQVFLVVLILAVGGLGYGVWEVYKLTQENNHSQKAVTNMQPIANDKIIEQVSDSTDRVTLIKNVQQKVFTIITSNSLGSGFLYAKGGYVATNAHVVDGEIDVSVRNSNGQEYAAKVIGISEHFDIALLHVPDYENEEPLAVESKESPIGLEVIAFGSPQGFENTASPGYITGQNRDEQVDRFIYKQIYQVDAQIDKGSSGGPLVDATSGKVVGINSLVYTSETSMNFAFSIPLYSMTSYFDEWIAQPMTRENILATAGIYNYYSYGESDNEVYYEEDYDALLAGQFVQSFRMYYEYALNDSNFYWIADMVTGVAYEELEDYVNDISYEGHFFHFLSNDILNVTYESGKYLVQTNETFDFYSATGDYEYFDRYKTYTVIIDQNEAFKISNISIH
ncbi:trypsin-like peptidase domain-containing protein [Metasolibacillus sp. FSL K6-0083]|uniref:trypsin-like peptidase domain-containing protein n=1 Tax=Metasolibacillus sp. FSL K6-0083 TaxID=2921416 RepID=UPI003159DB31